MYLPFQGFISSFRLLDILDILLVAFVLYKLFILIRNTRAVALIKGLLVLGVVTVVSKILDLHVINWMLQQGMTVILVALPVVFQPELRRALEQIGRGRFFRSGQVISMEELDKIAQGRVWTGSTAKELGLVDELGGLDKALEIAIAKAGVDAYTVMSYPKKEGFLESLMNTNPGNYIKGRMLNGKISDMYRQFSIIENFDKIDRIQARVPFELNIQ